MDKNTSFPTHLLPGDYLDHFSIDEFKFRWHEATGLDTKLHFRANHLASRLMSLWIVDANLSTSKAELARITNTSVKTMDRALVELEHRGWVDVTRMDRLSIYLMIPEHGMESLLLHRQRIEHQRELRATRETSTREVLLAVSDAYDVPRKTVLTGPQWQIIRSRVRSTINQMTDITQESNKLTISICESPPARCSSPMAVVGARIDEHLKRYPHLQRRKSKAIRDQISESKQTGFNEIIANLSNTLKEIPDLRT
jgi:hypothetical protein